MIRFAWLFARLRWRLAINGIKGAFRRDTAERLSRISALFVLALLFLLFLGAASLFGLLGYAGGRRIGESGEAANILLAGRILILAAAGLLVLVSLLGATTGTIASQSRLRLLPIPRRALHLVEVLASLADPWVAFLFPALLLFPVGLMSAGWTSLSVLALAAGFAMIALLASLATLLAMLLSWFLRSRRRAEMFTLVLVLAISMLAALPLLVSSGLGGRTFSPGEIDQGLPAWTRALPSELYGRSIEDGLSGRSGAAWLGVAVLFLEAGVLYGLSAATHRKVIESTESGGTRRRSGVEPIKGLRLWGLTPAVSAVALAQVRTALRSVRGRLIVSLPGPLLAVIGLLCRRVPGEFPGGSLLGSQGDVLLGAGIVFSLYALQAFTMNQFATDRAGLSRQFLAPISDLDLVKGKAIGCGLILAAAVLLCLICSLIVVPGGSPLVWLAVLLGGMATYLLLTPVAALLSAAFPVASDLSKTGSGGNPHTTAFLIGTLLIALLSAVPGLILGIAYHLLHRPGLALLLMAIWTLLAAAVALPFLRLAAQAVAPRRENLALVAQGR